MKRCRSNPTPQFPAWNHANSGYWLKISHCLNTETAQFRGQAARNPYRPGPVRQSQQAPDPPGRICPVCPRPNCLLRHKLPDFTGHLLLWQCGQSAGRERNSNRLWLPGVGELGNVSGFGCSRNSVCENPAGTKTHRKNTCRKTR